MQIRPNPIIKNVKLEWPIRQTKTFFKTYVLLDIVMDDKV